MTENQKLKMELLKEFAFNDEPKTIEVCRQMYKFMVEDEGQAPASKPDTKRLKENGYNVEAAQKCWDFVCVDDAKRQEPASDRLADGVYLIDTKGNAVAFADDDTCTVNDTAYIGIVQGSHSVAIALRDVSEGEIILTNKKDDGKGHYIDSYMDAVQDWQGKQNTEHLQAVGLNPAIQLRDGEYIPTLAELYLICLNRKTINAAMRFVGGQELAGWYWSSTEYSATDAWYLYLGYGSAYGGTKATSTIRVRPVSAFLHRASKPDTKPLKDGVYYVTTDSMVIPYSAVLTPPEDLKGVGVVMGERSIIVAITESPAGEETTLATRKDPSDLKGSYIEWCIDAVADWNGRENTEHLKAVGLSDNIHLEDGQYIPSMGEMYLIYMNRKTINEALEKANGQPIADDWYWTSTEFSAASAWRLCLVSGLMDHGKKASYTYRVRPVSAFNF